MERGAPVFVKVEEYKDILDTLDLVKEKVREMKDMVSQINSLRSEEASELAMWTHVINDIEKKIDNIDRMMFEPEQW